MTHAEFMARVKIEGGCWIWSGYVRPDREAPQIAHRRPCDPARWLFAFLGCDYPRISLVRACGNRLCVYPLHVLSVDAWYEKLFLSSVDVHGGNGCWLWTGSLSKSGYGKFTVAGKAWRAPRWAFDHWKRPLVAGEIVRHRCDNTKCVNPEHLEAGTNAQNTKDMFDRGRALHQTESFRQMHPASKLTPDQVREVRRRLGQGELQRVIAVDMGVLQSCISRIKTGVRRPHVV